MGPFVHSQLLRNENILQAKKLTAEETERIANYFASMNASTKGKLANEYRLAYLIAMHLIDVKTELNKAVLAIEAVLELDPKDFSESYVEELIARVRKHYEKIDPSLQT